MAPIYYRRNRCRLCDSINVECVFQLEPSALSEWYLPPERSHEAKQRYPLDLFLCHCCGHVQLFDVIDPVVLFTNYVYTSASSPGLAEHFRVYADHIMDKLNLNAGSLVVDIGSNDGTLLRQFASSGLRVIGIDPARDLAAAATSAGIPTIQSFLDQHAVAKVRELLGPAQLCTANNVFAHNDDLGSMADRIASLLSDDGVFVFEVSYLLDTIEKMVFDFIYHEHLCYHSVKPLVSFLHRHGLELFDIERVPTKGGSIRGFAQKLGGSRAISPAIERCITMEEAAGLYDPTMYQSYIARVNSLRQQTYEYLHYHKQRGALIVGYGASATVTTLLHHFRLGHVVDYLVDDNPIRHGTLSPGYEIPVKHPCAIYNDKADIVIILAWRFSTPILEKHRRFMVQGGKFVVPLPRFEEIRKVEAAAGV